MPESSTKPYLIRALHEWCTDNGYTPHIVVTVDANTVVPRAHIHDGQITLNIGSLATNRLTLGNDFIEFQARFSGVTEHIFVPVGAVSAIYARETGAGMGFEVQESQPYASGPADDAKGEKAGGPKAVSDITSKAGASHAARMGTDGPLKGLPGTDQGKTNAIAGTDKSHSPKTGLNQPGHSNPDSNKPEPPDNDPKRPRFTIVK